MEWQFRKNHICMFEFMPHGRDVCQTKEVIGKGGGFSAPLYDFDDGGYKEQ